ncbi:DUF1761 family protein [Pseudonocardia lacus]|uniref:DUF1761 family protein n=1 Tax=Pseudonocardia lacus TaxID=2835865 RepID=UPI001BDCDC93|nr:DUF1761 family protein [Pseudonocardia lacus]
MPELDVVEVLVAAALTFVVGAVYYAVLGGRLAAARGAGPAPAPMRWWTMPAEVVRSLVLAVAVLGLAAAVGVDDAGAGLVLGLVLFAGFPLVLWSGAVVHEGTPPAPAALHAGDWLVKLLALGLLAGVW